MSQTPESEPKSNLPDGMQEIPETPEIPAHIERAGVKSVPSQFTQQVTDDSGQPLTQSPSTQQLTIVVPASSQQLQDWTKGKPENAITWLAYFWLRFIKKAIHFGWNILSDTKKERV